MLLNSLLLAIVLKFIFEKLEKLFLALFHSRIFTQRSVDKND